jgi:tRNA(Arg) A34 adenosine deaminase TadA
MNNKIFNYFEIAAKLTAEKADQRSFLIGAIGVRKDGTMVKAINGPAQTPMPEAHAERRLASKLDHGAIVYVARVRLLNGEPALAKPCPPCMAALASRKVVRIYYTISNDEYGTINVKDWLRERQ